MSSLPPKRRGQPVDPEFFAERTIQMHDGGGWPPPGAEVFPYVRSSDGAAVRRGDGKGMDDQLAEIRAECERRGYIMLPEIREAYTGTVLTRIGFMTMLDQLKARPGAYVMMAYSDRLTRSSDPREGEVMAYMIDEAAGHLGALLIVGKEYTGIGGAITFKVDNYSSGSARVALVTKFAVRRRERLRGEKLPLGIGPSPYGYLWDAIPEIKQKRTRYILDRDLEHDNGERPERAAWILTQLAEGASAGRLRVELHRRGWKSPTGRDWWTVDRICRLVRNPIYSGQPEGGRWRSERHHVGGERMRLEQYATPVDMRVALREGTAPAIVTPEVQERAIASLERNARGGRKPLESTTQRHLLADGLATCYWCENVLTPGGASRATDTHSYYRCATANRTRKADCCGVGSVNAAALDDAAWERLVEGARNADKIEAWARSASGDDLPEVRELAAVDALLGQKMAEQAQRTRRFLELTDAQAELVKPVLDALAEDITALAKRQATLAKTVAAVDERRSGVLTVIAELRRLALAARDTPREQRRPIVEALGLRAVVKKQGDWTFHLACELPELGEPLSEPTLDGPISLRFLQPAAAIRIPLPARDLA